MEATAVLRPALAERGRARILRRRGLMSEAREAVDEAARIADELRDDELRKLVAAERRRP